MTATATTATTAGRVAVYEAGATARGFGATLRAARLDAGMTQGEAAARAGFWPSDVCQYEAGDHLPRPDTLGRLLDALTGDRARRGAIWEAYHAAARARGARARGTPAARMSSSPMPAMAPAMPTVAGDDRLVRGIARIEAQIADDLTRGGSAFTTYGGATPAHPGVVDAATLRRQEGDAAPDGGR